MDLETATGRAAGYRERLGRLSGAERLEMAASLSRGIRDLARAGLRHRHPRATEAELRWRFAALLYGRAAAERLYGPMPTQAP